jgi:phosphatidate phosphatase APP1
LRKDKTGEGSWRSKRNSIEQIMRAFPYRRFILCGDAGERDPELYATIGRTFGRQVARICIRQVAGKNHPSGISQKLIEELDPGRADRWTLFHSATELSELTRPESLPT